MGPAEQPPTLARALTGDGTWSRSRSLSLTFLIVPSTSASVLASGGVSSIPTLCAVEARLLGGPGVHSASFLDLSNSTVVTHLSDREGYMK